MTEKLGVGFVGGGFNTRFHIQGFTNIRDADVLGVWSPERDRADSAAALARALEVGDCRAYDSIEAMVADPRIDAIWISGPNHARLENVEAIVAAIESGRGTLRGLACEKPLARNLDEAIRVRDLAARVGLVTGYLENQLFSPHTETGKKLLWARGASVTGRPYLARAAEEHSGPHSPWFWQGKLQGGGVLNDMMCHSALLVRHLLTRPGEPLSSVRPIKVTGKIASLKWSRPEYVRVLAETMGKEVDYAHTPSEDFASINIEFQTSDGHRVMGEASTSWSYVGPGLRLSAELLGPEYSMKWNSLDSGLNLFFSRAVQGKAGEDLVEKQNAEIGMMPVVPMEAAVYGYEAEDRHFVRAFLGKEPPLLTFDDGVDVVEMLMTAYRSAEEERTIAFPSPGIREFLPAVARGAWRP
ncbi:MAG: Gfo/Idh/MocA family oxidoreductase [bacterium]